MTESVIFKKEQSGIAHVRLNRPDKRNAFDGTVIEELTKSIRKAAQDSDCRALVLSGEGRHFSAGADLEYMRSCAGLSHQENVEDANRLARLMDAVDRFPHPTVVRIQGAAFGGALGLICASDIAIAAERARFCLSEARLGLAPSTIGPYVVRAMGARQARRYFLTSEELDAWTAHRLNIVHEVVPDDDLDEMVESILGRILKNGPNALTQAKTLIDRIGQQQPDGDLMDYTANHIAGLRVSEQAQEGLGAFLEKRSPSWVQEATND